MPRDIRLGLVGFGSDPKEAGRGRTLLKMSVNHMEGIKAAGICDINPKAREMAGHDFPGVPVTGDFDRMLEECTMDALLIETPAHLHAQFAVRALQKNIHVLSDIPCVRTLEEGWSLWEAQKKSSAFYMTGANANMPGWIETALDLKKKGLFGDPFYVQTAYIHDCRDLWEATPWRKTGIPIMYCTHSLGPVLKLIDEDLAWVSCFDTGSHINKEEGQHDAMTAIFRTPSNVVVHLLTSFINNSPMGAQHNYRFFTTKGAFERTLAYPTFQSTEHAAQQRTLFYSKELYGYKNWIELPIDGHTRPEYASKKDLGHGGIDYVMMEKFFNAVRKGGPSPISLKEGLRMTLPGIYAYLSSQRGGELLKITYPWEAGQPLIKSTKEPEKQ
ncbi:MAG TPA: Gfo/Idh/MocA family oxidoreductase [bacterium]|nr:Gfo/Idh/MocA family oxidoreductase [bacterium]